MTRPATQRHLVLGVLAAGLILPAAGCGPSLRIWANSDSDDPTVYTLTNPHYVMPGETVNFRATLDPDTADYVLMVFAGQTRSMPKVKPGEYTFSYHFDESWRGRNTELKVAAYRRDGRPDIPIPGDYRPRPPSAEDPPDELLASDAMSIRCRQPRLELRFNLPASDKPALNKARLEIYGPGPKPTVIPHASPGQRGFIILEGNLLGGPLTLFYTPRPNEIHRSGETRAVLIVPQPDGQALRFEGWIDSR